MKRHVAGCFLVAGCMMLVAGGCAKEEMVKKDEGVVPTAAVAPAAAPAKKEVVKEQPVQQAPVKESAVKEEVKPMSQGELRAALDKIYFDFDSSKLTDADRSILAKNAEVMKKYSAAKVRIEGNCDERGSAAYNVALGSKRAETAKRYLVEVGASADQITTTSYGKERPRAKGHDEQAWSQNRRDDLVPDRTTVSSNP